MSVTGLRNVARRPDALALTSGLQVPFASSKVSRIDEYCSSVALIAGTRTSHRVGHNGLMLRIGIDVSQLLLHIAIL